ncbi:NAD(P)/FAD-dependent oxidoreductase [Virgibacillus doumboii]|uniref:NAD(P)/FAD-dependent oxidoreductase n=1 Tax=Virgibacillus doumboii TaxID=2697503 RepID=UPI0024838FFB|nr:FAD-binding oxidoreductase [Virgibacillus doumboii]
MYSICRLRTARLSPFNNSIRIGGTMEFSGDNTNIDMRRVESTRNIIFNYLKQPLKGSSEKVWAGVRPMTPDGIPVLGEMTGTKNIFIATGHVMSGVSMSLSTGYIMSELIGKNRSVIDLGPFSPERFFIKR